MKQPTYIALNELAKWQNERPGVFPVFGKIRLIKGELMGEVKEYSDAYGNPLPPEKTELKIYH